MPDVDTFSFGDISITEEAPEATAPVPVDDDAATPAPVVDVPVVDVPVLDVPVLDVPIGDVPVFDAPVVDVTAMSVAPTPVHDEPVSEAPSDASVSDTADDADDLDVPSFLAGFGASASTMTPAPASEESLDDSFEPWSVADVGPSTPPADHVPLTNFFAEAAAAVGAKHPSEVEAEAEQEAEVVDDEAPDTAAPTAVAPDNRSAFSAMLHATNTSPAPAEPHGDEALVEPAPPQPEPVQAFVQGAPATTEPVSAAADTTFVATAIQDDLLPQLPRRGRRRGADHSAPAVPAEVLRIAAAQTEPEAVAETAAAAVVVDVPAAPSPGAPPLPRRELDAEPVVPAPRAEPAPAPTTAETPRPNYELFAAFRAATDQGRADAVRRGDGGGA
jgi:hypothetical protein